MKPSTFHKPWNSCLSTDLLVWFPNVSMLCDVVPTKIPISFTCHIKWTPHAHQGSHAMVPNRWRNACSLWIRLTCIENQFQLLLTNRCVVELVDFKNQSHYRNTPSKLGSSDKSAPNWRGGGPRLGWTLVKGQAPKRVSQRATGTRVACWPLVKPTQTALFVLDSRPQSKRSAWLHRPKHRLPFLLPC